MHWLAGRAACAWILAPCWANLGMRTTVIWLTGLLLRLHILCSRMKRAQSTPHAATLRQASIEPFGSLHGSNGYGAYLEEQKLKNR